MLIKPDAIKLKLLGWCVACFEKHGISAMKLRRPVMFTLQEHYAEHQGKDFFPRLMEFMLSGHLVTLAVRGSVEDIRAEAEGIRKKWSQYVLNPRNLVHASDSASSAERELDIWFHENDYRIN